MCYYLAIVGQEKKVKLLSVLSGTGHLQIAEITLDSHLSLSQHSNCSTTISKDCPDGGGGWRWLQSPSCYYDQAFLQLMTGLAPSLLLPGPDKTRIQKISD